jgi:hypothetical protein
MSDMLDFVNADPQGTFRLVVGQATTAGDLLSNSESGVAVITSPIAGMANENNTTAGVQVVATPTLSEASGNWGKRYGRARTMCELGNGNIAYTYSGDGTTATTALNLRIKSLLGGTVARATISSSSGISGYRVQKINATTFAIVWQESTGLKLAIYNNDGTVAVAVAAVATLGAAAEYVWNFDVLANGDIAIAYLKTGGAFSFSRFNSSGALQGVETLIEGVGGGSANGVCVRPLAAGGFVIAYARSADQAYRFGRYNASGTLQGAVTTLRIASNAGQAADGGGNYEQMCVELTNGNLVFQVTGTTDGYIDLLVYSSAGSLLTTVDLGTNTLVSMPGEWASLAVTSSGFGVANRQSANYQSLAIFDNNGGTIFPPTTLGIGGSGGSSVGRSNCGTLLVSLGAAGFAMLTVGWDNANSFYDVRLISVSPTGVASPNAAQFESGTSVSMADACIVLTSSGLLALSYVGATSGVGPKFGVYKVMRRSVLGVALETVAKGAQCRIGTKGTYTLNTDYAQGGNFDNRANVIPGTRGTVAGTIAQLLGMS